MAKSKSKKTKLKKVTVRVMVGNETRMELELPAERAGGIPWSRRYCPSLGRITGCWNCTPKGAFKKKR